MYTCFKTNIGYYFSLALILILGFFLSQEFSYEPQIQLLIIVMTACFYVLWGILHHVIHHDLNAKIVIEYVLIGSLGMSLMLFLLKV